MTWDLGSPENYTPHEHHPMRIRKGKGKGKLPHEVGDDYLSHYLQEQQMDERDYWMTVGSGELYASEIERCGDPVFTKALSSDQSGWARIDYPDHFSKPGAKWFIRPDKPGRPIPARFIRYRLSATRKAA